MSTPIAHARRTRLGIVEGGDQVFGAHGSFALDETAAELRLPGRCPIVREVGTRFDVSGFERPRAPIALGAVDLDGVSETMRCSSLPLKFPHTDYRVPEELRPLRGLLELAAAAEHALNSDVHEYYAYLTVQRTRVARGEVQRGAAIHSDSIQGPRIQPKQPIERGYLATDRVPPRFFVQAFDMKGVDCDQHLLDAVFAAQAREEAAVTAPAGTLVLFDCYCVHQARPATEPGPRTFVRVAYSTRQYDRLGNAVNAAFAEEYRREGWQFVPRPLPQLALPPGYG